MALAPGSCNHNALPRVDPGTQRGQCYKQQTDTSFIEKWMVNLVVIFFRSSLYVRCWLLPTHLLVEPRLYYA
jgi:hypothetical protein